MKHGFVLCIFIILTISSYAQKLTEMQYLNGKWYLELTNDSGIPISSVKIISTSPFDTSFVKKSVIDSLSNRENSIIVITIDSLIDSLQINSWQTCMKAVFNDSIYSDVCEFSECQRSNNDYSIISLDSSDLFVNNYGSTWYDTNLNCWSGAYYNTTYYNTTRGCYYSGPSIPSLGKHNKREDAFVLVEGKFYYTDGTLLKNRKVILFNCWDPETGVDTIYVDSSGNYKLAKWADCFDQNSMVFKIEGDSCRDIAGFQCAYYTDLLRDAVLGTNYIDIDWYVWENTREVNPGEILLTLSPNPARSTITATYELPASEDYRRCQLRVYSNTGALARAVPLQSSSRGSQTIPLGGLPGGVYYCSLVGSQAVLATGRFVVE